MYIALKKEVKAYNDRGYIIIRNNISGSFRVLSKLAAILVYLLKGIRAYEDVKNDFRYLVECGNVEIELLMNEIRPYINLGEKLCSAGINELNMDNIVFCRSLSDISTTKQPTNVFLRATNLCDKECIYCSEMQRMRSKKKCHFPIELVKNIFLNFETKNVFFEITGGEPLLHPQLIDLLIMINRLSISTSLITKATRDYSFFRNLMQTKAIARVCFSLDSYRDEYVDYITGKEGTFSNIIECMKIANTYGTAIDVNAVITTQNANEIEKIISFCVNQGVENLHFTTVWPVHNMDSSLIVTERDNQIIYDILSKMSSKYKNHISIELTTSKCEGENRCEKCGKALSDVKIDSDGEVSLCNGTVIGDLNNACLYDIWNSERARKIRNELMKQMATRDNC